MRPMEAVIARAIWDVDLSNMPGWRAWLTRVLRVAHAVANDVAGGQLTLRAMSLVYTTLLSLVPLLAVSFSVLKGFGVHNQIEPLLLNFLAPLGEKGEELALNIVGFVENVKVGVLGSLGLALLLYTVVSLIQKIESAFNYTWHTTSSRSLGQRFSNYLSVIMVGPLLMFAALGITATVTSMSVVQWVAAIEPFGAALRLLGQLVPYLLVITAFTFVYVFVPNTRVRPGAALTGAVVAGFLWETAGWLFASFVANSTKYAAIYSGFAIVMVFMIWLYVSWLILLLGASLAFYVQHPEQVVPDRQQRLSTSSRVREKVALLVMARIGRAHQEGRPPQTLEALASWLALPMDIVALLLDRLCESGVLVETAGEPPAYVPARALGAIRVKDLLDAVRSAAETSTLTLEQLPAEGGVEGVLSRLEQAVSEALGERTVEDLSGRP